MQNNVKIDGFFAAKLKEMIKTTIIFFKKYFFSQQWFIKINLKRLPTEMHSFNHLNIFFSHNNQVKNRILTKNYFKKTNKFMA